MINSYLNINRNKKSSLAILSFAGILMFFALPPFNFYPIFLISVYVLWINLENAQNKKEAFFISYIWGGFYSIAGFYWVINALTLDKFYYIFIPFAILGIFICLGFFKAILGFIIYITPKAHNDRYKLVSFVIFGTFLEILQGSLFTGLPWNSYASIIITYSMLVQTAYIWGESGVSFIVLFFTIALIYIFRGKFNIYLIIICFLIFLALIGYGFLKISLNPVTYNKDVRLRIVQPNIPQSDIYYQNNSLKNWQDTLNLAKYSKAESNDDLQPTHIILPEGSIPFTLNDRSLANLSNNLSIYIPKDGYIITGAIRTENKLHYNSILFINKNGVEAIYDKVHLVPFGEYVPFSDKFPILNPVVGIYNFTSGNRDKIIHSNNLPPVIASICYEIIFSYLYKNNEKKAEWILNITNMGWFGNSTALHQLLVSARFRAIEQGLPVVLVGNTGISAIIGPNGDLLRKTNAYSKEVIDSYLPKQIKNPYFFIPLIAEIV